MAHETMKEKELKRLEEELRKLERELQEARKREETVKQEEVEKLARGLARRRAEQVPA